MWWEPARNVRRLGSYLLAPRHRWLVAAWWTSWVAFRLAGWLVMWQLWMPSRLLLDPTIVAIVAAAVTLASTALAVTLIHLLTTALLQRVRTPYVIDFVKRPFPLFIVGIGCRVATPVVVIELVTLVADRFS